MWIFIAILNLHLIFGATDFIDGPRNMVVIAGERMEMECRADSNSTISEWSMQRPFKSNKEIIFTNWKDQKKINKAHFGIVEGMNGLVVLYTNSTEMDDAGTYTCAVQKELRQPNQLSAQLIVIETKPLCETNLSTSQNNILEEGTNVWMRCAINFTGNWNPTLEWRLHEGNGETDEEPKDLTDWVNAVIVPNASVSSTLTVALNATSNSSYYSCKIYFTSVARNHRPQAVTANNTPDYNYIWKSPLLIALPKVIILPSTQLKQVTTEDPTKSMKDSTLSFNAFNAIYLVAGVAILFGIASSLVALTLCLRLKRKNNSASMTLKNSTEVEAGEYDLIPYACTDGYDTIEEVEEKDDILLTNFPPRLGPLPSPGYSGLIPDESKPPGVYSRMDHQENSVDDEESDVDRNNPQSDINRSKPYHSNLSDVEETTKKRTMPVNSYLDLETEINIVEDIAPEGENIPSAYLRITDDSLQSKTNNSVQEANQECEIPSSYLTTREIHVDSSSVQNNIL